MAKTIIADFDPGQTILLKLWNDLTNALIYNNVPLVEIVGEDGAYFRTQVFITGRYRSALLIGGFVVQRSKIYIGEVEDTTYHIGNWEGNVDIGQGFYLTGGGAFLITITVVDDNLNPIEDANVSLYRTGDERHGITDVNGQVFFFSNAVTWTTVAITAPGFTFVTVPLVIVANTIVPDYVGSPINIVLPPVSAFQVNVVAQVFDEFGDLENGVEINVKMHRPSSLSGIFDKKTATFTSVAGIVILEKLFQGAWYYIWRKDASPMLYKVPITEEVSVNIDPLLGDDETDPCLTV